MSHGVFERVPLAEKILEKMTEALFWALVESRAIDHRRYPLFLPIRLRVALPKLGVLYVEQALTEEERLLQGVDDQDPIMKFKPSSKHRPFLSSHAKPDAAIVRAIWSECKTGLKKNVELRVTKVFTIAIEMVIEHLVDAMLLPEDLQDEKWVNFVQRVRKMCQGRVA